jgi:hypothetical protein
MRATLKIGLCAIGIMVSSLTSAEGLGRLFFTPEQRTQLDYSYAREDRSDNIGRTLMLNGIVQKHGGKRTVWINEVARQAGSSDEKTPEIVSVPVPGQTKTIKLKVGQRILLGPSDPGTTNPDRSKQDASKP